MSSKAKFLSQLWSSHLAHTMPWVLYLSVTHRAPHRSSYRALRMDCLPLPSPSLCYLGLALLVKGRVLFLSPFPTTRPAG